MSDMALELALGGCRSRFGKNKAKVGASYQLFKKNGVKDIKKFLQIVIREVRKEDIPFIDDRILVVRKGHMKEDGRKIVRYDIVAVYPWFNNGRS